GRPRPRRREQPPQQDPPQERAALPVHTGVHGVPARARLPPGAARRHRGPPHVRVRSDSWDSGGAFFVPPLLEWCLTFCPYGRGTRYVQGSHGGVAGPGAAVRPADRDARRQERRRGRRVHRVLAAGHRPRPPRRRQGRGHRRYARELRRDRGAGGGEGRDGAQDRLPRRARAAGAGSARRRGWQPGQVRLRLRGRGQGQLPPLPRAAAAAGQGRGAHRLRQHAMGRLRGRAGRRGAVGARPGARGDRQGVQRGAHRRPPCPGVPARHLRRDHAVPPRRV
ncbi:hypothetical protein CFC21_066308, partial [Triticum aestivum]|uniref:Uncharacterized protein n=2 Tax=Triticum aestivum TaxID=4565 RepID=A0A3B6KK58_WHEAT